MSLLTQRYVLLAKIESTPGTDPTPTASTDALLAENLQISFTNEVIDPNPGRPSLSPEKPIQGRKYGQLTFDCPIRGSGAAGTAPEFGALLRACGLAETVSAGVSVTYAPRSSGFEYVTIYAYRDGLLYEFNGCQGTCEFQFPAGQRANISFTLQGECVDVVDAALPSPTVDSTVAPTVVGTSFSIASYAAIIANLNVALQNRITMPDDVNDASGYGLPRITGRDTAGSFDPEAVLVATHDFWSDWEDGTSQALTITLGATAGNILTFTAPAVVDRELSIGDRNGIMIHEVPFTCAASSGDDEISAAFT